MCFLIRKINNIIVSSNDILELSVLDNQIFDKNVTAHSIKKDYKKYYTFVLNVCMYLPNNVSHFGFLIF